MLLRVKNKILAGTAGGIAILKKAKKAGGMALFDCAESTHPESPHMGARRNAIMIAAAFVLAAHDHSTVRVRKIHVL